MAIDMCAGQCAHLRVQVWVRILKCFGFCWIYFLSYLLFLFFPFTFTFTFTFTYPLATDVVGASQMTSQLVSSIFLCSPLPLGLGKLQACPFLDVVFPPLFFFLVCNVFFPLSLCLARWFWPDLTNGRHVHTTSVCVILRWSGGLRVVRLPA